MSDIFGTCSCGGNDVCLCDGPTLQKDDGAAVGEVDEDTGTPAPTPLDDAFAEAGLAREPVDAPPVAATPVDDTPEGITETIIDAEVAEIIDEVRDAPDPAARLHEIAEELASNAAQLMRETADAIVEGADADAFDEDADDDETADEFDEDETPPERRDILASDGRRIDATARDLLVEDAVDAYESGDPELQHEAAVALNNDFDHDRMLDHIAGKIASERGISLAQAHDYASTHSADYRRWYEARDMKMRNRAAQANRASYAED